MKKLALLLACCLMLQCIGIPAALGEGEAELLLETEALAENAGNVEEVPAVDESVVAEKAVEAPIIEEAPAVDESVGAEKTAEALIVEESAAAELPFAEEAPVAEEKIVSEEAPVTEKDASTESIVPANEELAIDDASENTKEQDSVSEDAVQEENPIPAEEPVEPVGLDTEIESAEIEDEIHLAEICDNAYIFEDEGMTKAACRVSKKAVVYIQEMKEAVSRIQFALVTSQGNLEVATGFVWNKDVAVLDLDAETIWQNAGHAVKLEVNGFVLEPLQMSTENQQEQAPADDLQEEKQTGAPEIVEITEPDVIEVVVEDENTADEAEEIGKTDVVETIEEEIIETEVIEEVAEEESKEVFIADVLPEDLEASDIPVIENPEAEIGVSAASSFEADGIEVTDEEAADVLGAGEWEFLADVLSIDGASGDFAVDAGGTLIQYNGADTVVQIPLTVLRNGTAVPVTGIEDSAFAGNTVVTQIIIPTSVTWIDTGAFKGCTALESINLPDNVVSISAEAFSGCSSLKSVSWSDSVSTIRDRAFYNCISLQTLGSSSNVLSIGDYAFYGCSSLTTITWSNQLTRIGKYSYANCTGLAGLSFPASLITVDDYAFAGCRNIQKLDFQGNTTLKTISTGAFQNCSTLKSIYIPDSVEYLGNSAFENCTSATVLSLPTSLTVIQDFTFRNCTSLQNISIPVGVTDIHREAFYGCSNVSYVYTIPNTVVFIGNHAFYGLKDDCCFVVENAGVEIGIDALGTSGIVFGWRNSTAEAYANSHGGVTFYDIRIVNYVRRCYTTILNRIGEPDGVVFWSKLLAGRQANGGEIVHQFVFSQEFANRGLNNGQVVEVLYGAMQGRASDPTGKAYWTSALDIGCSYDYVIAGFCSSAEFHGICNDYGINPGIFVLTQNRDLNIQITAYVQRCYNLIQNRAGDADGLNYWTGRLLRKEDTGAGIVSQFLASAEFKNRGLSDADQVEILYNTMMNRPSDATGKAYWLSYMAQNMSIEYVLKGFADSVEFRFLCSGYGIVAGPFTPHEYRDWNAAVTMYVNRLYQYALNRMPPDNPGLNTRTGLILTKNATPASVAVDVFTSLESQLQWFNNAEFVDRVYRAMLNRPATSAEISVGVNSLNNGQSRRDFVITVGYSDEFNNFVAGLGL